MSTQIGSSSTADYWGGTTEALHAAKATASASGNLASLSVVFHGTPPEGTVRLGVYSDSDGYPGSLLLDTGTVAMEAGTKTISGLTLAITSTTVYWLVAHPVFSSGTIYFKATAEGQPAGSSYQKAGGPGALPGTYPIDAASKDYFFSIYGMIEAATATNVVLNII